MITSDECSVGVRERKISPVLIGCACLFTATHLSLLLVHLFALMPLHSILKANHISYIFKRMVAYNWYRC